MLVVGAGTAGAPLAARMSEDADRDANRRYYTREVENAHPLIRAVLVPSSGPS